MAELNLEEMIARFAARAAAVKQRPLPPVAGEERQRFIEQASNDFQDFALIAGSSTSLVDGILTFTVDLRPANPNS